MTTWQVSDSTRRRAEEQLALLMAEPMDKSSDSIDSDVYSRRDNPLGMPPHQMQFYPPGWTVRGLPGHYFRTFSAALIFDARTQLGLNKKEFAALVSVPESVMNRLENGRRDPNSGTLLSILYAAGFFVEAKVVRNYLKR